MQSELLAPASETFPEVVLESLRKPFPFPRSKKNEMLSLERALIRLTQGELSASPMAAAEAVEFLRAKINEAVREFYGRPRNYTPHLTTWLNQSRYLRSTPPDAVPQNLLDAVLILQCYPTIAVNLPPQGWTQQDIDANMPAIRLVDEHIRFLGATHGQAAASYIRTRVIRYAECVAKWPQADWQYIPRVTNFFKDRRYEQDERLWTRNAAAGFSSEREQLQRLA